MVRNKFSHINSSFLTLLKIYFVIFNRFQGGIADVFTVFAKVRLIRFIS